MSICGVVAIDKQGGMTSHDVVNRVRRIFGIKKVGHAGTLDPMATGVLVVCLGAGTRIAEYLAASRKTYRAGVVFGITTNSEDSSGHIIAETDASSLTEQHLLELLPGYLGHIKQIPPMVSAVHHEGKRLYDLARQGIEVERQPREIEIYRIEPLGFTPGRNPRAEIEVECSAGTYIRTLAADLGESAGVGAMMDSLRRIQSGRFSLADCHTLDELAERKESGTLESSLVSIGDALPDWPRVVADPAEAMRIAHGQSMATTVTGNRVLILSEAGETIAIATAEGGQMTPIKVFNAES